jgi:hypothetical protein
MRRAGEAVARERAVDAPMPPLLGPVMRTGEVLEGVLYGLRKVFVRREGNRRGEERRVIDGMGWLLATRIEERRGEARGRRTGFPFYFVGEGRDDLIAC